MSTQTKNHPPDPPPHPFQPPATNTTKKARGLLLKTLVFSLAVTAAIWAFPYEAIGWEPTNEHILITVRARVRFTSMPLSVVG